MKTLLIKDLTINYGNNIVLKDFNCSLEEDEILVILGPSGCGKSTLLYGISGLLKPKKGEIKFENTILFSEEKCIDVPVENRNIGFVFQDYSLWPHMTVFENIAYPLRVRKIPKKTIAEKINNLLGKMEILDKGDSYPSELSGGEKQRVAIARAIASNPAMMLLDEPLANIDAALKGQLLNLIVQLNEDFNVPMIYVTHDQKEAFEIADRIIVMKDGKISQVGSPKEIYSSPKNKFTANFVGDNNMVRCCHFNKHKFSNNNEDLLVIRPEDVVISTEGRYSGKIHKISYRGYCYSLHVKFKGISIIANVNSDEYKVGSTIKFDIKKAHILDEERRCFLL